jgi:mono/diheme cytochrome c family protein
MRTVLLTFCLVACGGEAPKPAPAPAPAPAPVAAPPPAPVDPINKDADISAMADAEKHEFLMTLGDRVYHTGDGGIACTTCHGPEGKGVPPAFPPLVGQKDHMGDCVNHAWYVVNGLQGELKVDGVVYNGIMTAQGTLLNDLQIAAVTTWERNMWGNAYGDCSPDDVKLARTSQGKGGKAAGGEGKAGGGEGKGGKGKKGG